MPGGGGMMLKLRFDWYIIGDTFQIELEFRNVSGEGKPEYLEKFLSEQGQDPTTYMPTPGIEPGPH